MLQIENEYETQTESNYFQNNNNHRQNPGNIQEKTDYTEQKNEGSSSTNKKCQNTSNRIKLPQEKIWKIPLHFESPKIKDFQSPDL